MSQTFCVHYYVVIIFLVFLLFVCSLIVLRKMTKIGVDFLSSQWKWKYSEELCSCAKSQQLKKDYAPSLIKEHLQKKHHISGNHWCVPPMHPLRITQFSDYLFLCYLSWFVKTPNTWWTRKNVPKFQSIYTAQFSCAECTFYSLSFSQILKWLFLSTFEYGILEETFQFYLI